MMDQETKKNVAARLKRIAGQVAGIQKMVAEDRYCVDTLMQLAAARAALGKTSTLLLESHIRTCVRGAFETKSPQDRNEKIEELIRVFDKSCGP